jgi:hypothetical protein
MVRKTAGRERRDDAGAASASSQDELLRKLSESSRGSGVGVVLTPKEMQVLRDLSSLGSSGEPESAPRKARRTSELVISDEERAVLGDLALEHARESQPSRAPGPRSRRRTTEIQVSSTELEFLRRLSYDPAVGPAAGVQERLDAAPRTPRRRVTLELTLAQARVLARAAESRPDPLTDGERDALEALRSKLGKPRPGRRHS